MSVFDIWNGTENGVFSHNILSSHSKNTLRDHLGLESSLSSGTRVLKFISF